MRWRMTWPMLNLAIAILLMMLCSQARLRPASPSPCLR
jgi:hypothetical protein